MGTSQLLNLCCCTPIETGCDPPSIGDTILIDAFYQTINKGIGTYDPYGEGCGDSPGFEPPIIATPPTCNFDCEWIGPTGIVGLDQAVLWRQYFRIDAEIPCTFSGVIGTPAKLSFRYEGTVSIERNSEGIDQIINGPTANDDCSDIQASTSSRNCITLGDVVNYWMVVTFLSAVGTSENGTWEIHVYRLASPGVPDLASRYFHWRLDTPNDEGSDVSTCYAIRGVLTCAIPEGEALYPVGTLQMPSAIEVAVIDPYSLFPISGLNVSYYVTTFTDPTGGAGICCDETIIDSGGGFISYGVTASEGYVYLERTD